MQIETLEVQDNHWVCEQPNLTNKENTNLIFVFGDTQAFKQPHHFDNLRALYPNALIAGCSSSGHIQGVEISESSLIATAIEFSSSHVELSTVYFKEDDNLELIAQNLIEQLPQQGLKHVFILSEGLKINGSKLVQGLNKVSKVPVTGGLAGDGERFQETWVIANGPPQQNQLVALGFYGEQIHVGHGCFSGWSSFGTQRTITKSKNNVVYEIDNQPALELYKTYLGDYASELPSSGLRFPLNIKKDDSSKEVIRTLLAIDEDENSITFAGDVPEGYLARLMKPEIDDLIEGAGKAAENIDIKNDKQALGLVVSCVGRKLVINQMIEEELEAVQDKLGNSTTLTGFYSYGEIAPNLEDNMATALHNQTMTLTVIFED